MIKAAFFDVDGTLLSHVSRSVPASAIRALEELRKKGILCVVATGRQITEYNRLPVASIPFDGYILLNGQMLLDEKKQILSATELTGEPKEFLVRCFREKTFPVTLVERDRIFVNYVDELVQAVHDSLSSPFPSVDEYGGAPLYQVCAYMLDEDKAHLDPIRGNCVITRWHYGGYDVIASGGGKVKGIADFLEQKGLKREEIIAFGDGENDIEMLRFAGIGVALGNACDQAKEAADYVTADIDDDGIAKALKHFGLIE